MLLSFTLEDETAVRISSSNSRAISSNVAFSSPCASYVLVACAAKPVGFAFRKADSEPAQAVRKVPNRSNRSNQSGSGAITACAHGRKVLSQLIDLRWLSAAAAASGGSATAMQTFNV